MTTDQQLNDIMNNTSSLVIEEQTKENEDQLKELNKLADEFLTIKAKSEVFESRMEFIKETFRAHGSWEDIEFKVTVGAAGTQERLAAIPELVKKLGISKEELMSKGLINISNRRGNTKVERKKVEDGPHI